MGTEKLSQLLRVWGRGGPTEGLEEPGGLGPGLTGAGAGLRGGKTGAPWWGRSHGLQQEACRRPHSGYALDSDQTLKPPRLGKKVQALDSLTLETANQQVLLNVVEVVVGGRYPGGLEDEGPWSTGQGWDNVSLRGHWPGCCHLGSPTTYYLCTPGKSLAPQGGGFPICNRWIITDPPFVGLLCSMKLKKENPDPEPGTEQWTCATGAAALLVAECTLLCGPFRRLLKLTQR